MLGMPIEQIHGQMMGRQKDMFSQMDQMHSQMMKGFGGGSLFDNDPFFKDSGFGGSLFNRGDDMFAQMTRAMGDMPRPEQLG